MRELDRGVTEEERYWHGWPWALSLLWFVLVCYWMVGYITDRRWGWAALMFPAAVLALGTIDKTKKKFYLRRNNAQARQDVKF